MKRQPKTNNNKEIKVGLHISKYIIKPIVA